MKHNDGSIGRFAIIKNEAYPIIAVKIDAVTICLRLNFLVKTGNKD
jgi:hypothetical protein